MSLRNLKNLKDHNRQEHKKELAKLFLSNWNRAVKLWNNGDLFSRAWINEDMQHRHQKEYARICCAWLIPNRFAEPHVVASGG